MKWFLILICSAALLIGEQIKVTFVNPGAIDDPFFRRLCTVMKSAAKDLNIDLEILYSGRDYIQGLVIGKEILHRSKMPDYLLLINEDGIAERLLVEADSLNIKCVLFNEGLSDKFIEKHGDPVKRFPNLITQLLPNDSLAGYLLATQLIEEGRKRNTPIELLGLSGSPRTSSSILRTKGLQKALKENPDVNLTQIIPAHWREEKAAYITAQAYKRYPNINLIWSASDLMAKGAYTSLTSKENSCILGGIDWATFAFDMIKKGSMQSTVGGHFFDGAWALVLINDHAHNIPQKKKYISNSFFTISSENISTYYPLLMKNKWDFIDFTTFSKSCNKSRKNYDFTLTEIFKAYDKNSK